MSSVLQFGDTLRTPLSYYGGKQSMAHIILPMIPIHKVYTEVYFGGGTIFFAKDQVPSETINDNSGLVINFWQVLQNKYKQLKKMVDDSLVSRAYHAKSLCMIKWPQAFTDVEIAWAFWYACNLSYSNKPTGGMKYSNHQGTREPKILQNKKDRFTEELVERIKNATIECREATWILNSRNTETAFHYIDPPYLNSDQGMYAGFKDDNMEELLDVMVKLTGKWILSNYHSDILSKYVDQHQWHVKEVTREISASRAKARSGKKQTEVLVLNYLPELKDTLF